MTTASELLPRIQETLRAGLRVQVSTYLGCSIRFEQRMA